MQQYYLLLFFLCSNLSLFAQTKITGIVTSTDKEPLAFVNILINGNTAEGLSSDIDGKFSIDTKTNLNFLEFRYVGYEQLT